MTRGSNPFMANRSPTVSNLRIEHKENSSVEDGQIEQYNKQTEQCRRLHNRVQLLSQIGGALVIKGESPEPGHGLLGVVVWVKENRELEIGTERYTQVDPLLRLHDNHLAVLHEVELQNVVWGRLPWLLIRHVRVM